jgi:hypothetical protein
MKELRNKKGQFVKGHKYNVPLEARLRGVEKRKGQKRTIEQKRRMSEATKRYWANPDKHNELLRRSKIGAYIMSQRKGKNNPRWKGGRYKSNGYIHILIDGIYRLEHRYLIENYLGRELKGYEHIHHLNGIKDDNRLENLKIVINKNHYGEIRCPKCEYEFLIK